MVSNLSDTRVLKRLLEHMNITLPANRERLSELLESKEPSYVGRDGSRFVLDPDELALVRNVLIDSGLVDMKLPILIFADASHEQSTWRVEGREECTVIAKILDREVREPLYLYLAHMAVIRRKLPTTTVSVFA